jgi:hypothetical protein
MIVSQALLYKYFNDYGYRSPLSRLGGTGEGWGVSQNSLYLILSFINTKA